MNLSMERHKPHEKTIKQTHAYLKKKKYPMYESLKSTIKPTKE